jgi:hypothetical protein
MKAAESGQARQDMRFDTSAWLSRRRKMTAQGDAIRANRTQEFAGSSLASSIACCENHNLGKRLSGWTNFAVVRGAATAVLLGLPFSCRSGSRRSLGPLSCETDPRRPVALLLTGLLVAALPAVPGQRKGPWVSST